MSGCTALPSVAGATAARLGVEWSAAAAAFSIAVPSMGDGRAASRRRRTSSARVSSKRLRHGSSGVP